MVNVRLNPAHDLKAYAAEYKRNGIVQIHDFFAPEAATAVREVLVSLPWRLICQNDEHQLLLLTREQLMAMPQTELRKLEAGMAERAAANLGYTYLAYPMIEAERDGWDPGHPIHEVTRFVNGPQFLGVGRALLAEPAITKVDAHATKYQRGHYLTRHSDDGRYRRAAYTLGFSPGWQPDWGGLLMFLDERQDVASGYLPRFNTLTVFDGLRVHSVTSISQFTPQPRLSVTGWFRAEPA